MTMCTQHDIILSSLSFSPHWSSSHWCPLRVDDCSHDLRLRCWLVWINLYVLLCQHAANHDVIEAVHRILQTGIDRLSQQLEDAEKPLTDAGAPDEAVVARVVHHSLGALDVGAIARHGADGATEDFTAQPRHLITRILQTQAREHPHTAVVRSVAEEFLSLSVCGAGSAEAVEEEEQRRVAGSPEHSNLPLIRPSIVLVHHRHPSPAPECRQHEDKEEDEVEYREERNTQQ